MYYIVLLMLVLACQVQDNKKMNEEVHEHEEGVIHFSEDQFRALSIKVDKIGKRNLSAYVETNGQLTLPPQSEATVTTMIGANITEIKVIEGDKIRKGDVLAYMSHPDLIKLQSDYIGKKNALDYLQQEYQRQKKLYDEKINSGSEYQKIKSEYLSLSAEIKGLESTLNLIHLNPKRIFNGEIYSIVPLLSPIGGYIRSVDVRMGQYVQAQQELFKIVNNDHIHAHFLVYESDIQKVKIGQQIRFKVASIEDRDYEAIIFSVGKVFESKPKAVEIHAEIENNEGQLISGMYCKGQIITENILQKALPEDAVVRDGDKKYIFAAHKHELEWEFLPVEVITGIESDGWIEVKPLEKLDSLSKFVYNQAYYLLSEWKKEETGHSH